MSNDLKEDGGKKTFSVASGSLLSLNDHFKNN